MNEMIDQTKSIIYHQMVKREKIQGLDVFVLLIYFITTHTHTNNNNK